MPHTESHTHDDEVAVWFKALDVVVWASVAIIAILAMEWLGGLLVREGLARSASKYLAKVDELRSAKPEGQ